MNIFLEELNILISTYFLCMRWWFSRSFKSLFSFNFYNRHLIKNYSITITASRQLITDWQHWLTNSDIRVDWHNYNLRPIPVLSRSTRASPSRHEGIELFKSFLEGEPGQVVAAGQARHYLHIATFKGMAQWLIVPIYTGFKRIKNCIFWLETGQDRTMFPSFSLVPILLLEDYGMSKSIHCV